VNAWRAPIMTRLARGNRPESWSGFDNPAVDVMEAGGAPAPVNGPNEDGMTMLEKPLVSEFSHVKPGDTPWLSGGLRDFFLYRDLGIAAATGGRVIAQLVKANEAPEKGTGWHRHQAEFHIVLMLKGWAKFMYENEEHLVAAGDCVHQRPGITHYLFDYSPDMEYLEVVGPADFPSIEVEGPCAVPAPAPWP
jgi:mannose-6-phosphate isomerase-like protein (cupin superfamily)